MPSISDACKNCLASIYCKCQSGAIVSTTYPHFDNISTASFFVHVARIDDNADAKILSASAFRTGNMEQHLVILELLG